MQVREGQQRSPVSPLIQMEGWAEWGLRALKPCDREEAGHLSSTLSTVRGVSHSHFQEPLEVAIWIFHFLFHFHSPVIVFPLRKRGSFSSASLQHNQSAVRTLMITWRLIQLPVACPGSLLNHFLPRSICGFRMMGVVFFGASSLEMCSRLPPLNRCSRRSLLTRQTVFLLFLFAPSSAYRCVQLSYLKSCWFSLAATEVEKLTLHFLLLHTDQKLKKNPFNKTVESCQQPHETSDLRAQNKTVDWMENGKNEVEVVFPFFISSLNQNCIASTTPHDMK